MKFSKIKLLLNPRDLKLLAQEVPAMHKASAASARCTAVRAVYFDAAACTGGSPKLLEDLQHLSESI